MTETANPEDAPQNPQVQSALETIITTLNAYDFSQEDIDYIHIAFSLSLAMGVSAPRMWSLQQMLSIMRNLSALEEEGHYMSVQEEEDISGEAIPFLEEALQSAFSESLSEAADDAASKGKH